MAELEDLLGHSLAVTDASIDQQYNGIEAVNVGWDDLRFSATTLRQGASTKPDFDDTELGLLFPQNDASEIAYIIGQFPHARKNGSDIHPHVHWVQTSATTPTWKMDYRWYKNGETIPAWTTIETNGGVFPYTSGSMPQISSFPTIDGSLIDSVSSILDVKLYRDDDDLSGDALLKEFDIHYQIDQERGSKTEFAK